MPRRSTTALLSAAAVVPFLAGCATDDGGDDDPVSGSATGETTTSQEPTSDAETTDAPTPDPPVSDQSNQAEGEPDFPDGTARQTAENSGEWDLVLSDVRVGEHEGFDRIVLEFTGTGTPGWTVNYVDEAVLDGSGEVVALDGDAFLDIYASGTTYPASEGDYYSGPRQFQPDDGGDIDDVYVGGTFEGYTQVLVGIDGDRAPFRVFALTEPSRLVVDVADGTEP